MYFTTPGSTRRLARSLVFLLVPALALVISTPLWASLDKLEQLHDPVQKGLAIAHETERRDAGFGDYVVEAEMILMQNDQVLSEREFFSKVLEISGDGDHSVNVFRSPRDVEGTAILIHSHGLKPDDQWLYLPAIKRVKRISTRSKSGPFVGSEFAYEDISTWQPEKYGYRFLKSDRVDDVDCFLVENTPLYEDSGYSKLHEWVDKTIFRPRRIDYFDRKGDLLKTLRFEDYRQYQGQWWRPGRMIMTNHQTGRVTQLLWKDYQFATGLTEADLAQSKLNRLQ
ncbi:outer membrane lipoprotein-sorting protein [Pseudomaricurvus alcaniphilus]|uniref:outer membrane lipoprotein-sorting protein n=1 Tax=Pseudomaricurvus alcaniphilus TaxID=1166482 RepID=UPI00140740D6|nr:outer membrane lipoprotein-sorting protein [Pseudomaricurvus alcaniphilus]NHN38210.1 outer membrane lipoprotein-sorting protein [Pseudomaricurvus alcaniphilus]